MENVLTSLAALGSAGPVLALLAVLSVLSVAVFLSRLMALGGIGRGAGALAQWLGALENGDAPTPPQAEGPAGRVAERAATLLARNVPEAALANDLTQAGDAEVAAMSRGLRLLELIGTIAPLLGLLGTVLGMIQSFRSLELAEGAANASILAGGIWQALLTTAAGLIVAIPALVGAAILQQRVARGAEEIERLIARVALVRAMRGP